MAIKRTSKKATTTDLPQEEPVVQKDRKISIAPGNPVYREDVEIDIAPGKPVHKAAPKRSRRIKLT